MLIRRVVPAIVAALAAYTGLALAAGMFLCHHYMTPLAQHGYTLWISYQPASLFWPFQWIEGGCLLTLSVLLIAATVRVVRRRGLKRRSPEPRGHQRQSTVVGHGWVAALRTASPIPTHPTRISTLLSGHGYRTGVERAHNHRPRMNRTDPASAPNRRSRTSRTSANPQLCSDVPPAWAPRAGSLIARGIACGVMSASG
jgi:hypothetical protein